MKINYFAYGPNINHDFMKKNCPNAKPLGVGYIKDYALSFVGYAGNAIATIIQKPGSTVPVLVWEIEKDERALILNQTTLPLSYKSEEIKAQFNSETIKGFVYLPRNPLNSNVPDEKYFEIIKQGYEQNGLDSSVLYDALSCAT